MSAPTTPFTPPQSAQALTRTFWEGYELWRAGCDLWLEYLTELPGVRSPEALMNINIRYMARGLDISGLAAGDLLKDAGLSKPTLVDA